MKLDPNSDVSQFVTFTLDKEIFGVLIHAVEEIITLPDKVTPVPKAPSYFSGMINLRGEVISVIDLKKRLSLPSSDHSDSTRIMIVSIADAKVGMIVDSVSRVLPIAANHVLPPPAIMHQSNASYIFGSVQQADSVLLLLDTDQLIRVNELAIYSQIVDNENLPATRELQASAAVKERILIGFKLGFQNYALDIKYIEEIIELPKITPVPEMSHLIEGIFHQRNQALPILYLGNQFRLPPSEITEETTVLIINDSGLVMGYIVDQITEVFRAYDNEIIPPPPNVSGRSAEQLEGILKVKQNDTTEVVMALNVEKILSDEEHEYLIQLNEGLNDGQDDPADHQSSSEVISILKFHVGEEIFAIRVPDIDEITIMQKMVPVPKAPPFVNGVINLRGDVITIIDLAKVFGNTAQSAAETTRIVIVSMEEQKAGFQVDRVIGIEHVPLSLFEKPSGLIRGQYNLFVEGIGRTPDKDEVIILMDIGEILIQSETYDGEWGNHLLGEPEDRISENVSSF
ncbi:MAG: chemotaxis protein CheW [SAR324 cluster bacterium]|nr:chemotaxis protein CheW [SAR324 cluster bacterium]